MTKRDHFRFYPDKWRGNPNLRYCSMAARGLLIELLALMAQSKPYGYLAKGVTPTPPTEDEIALAVSCPREDLSPLFCELLMAGLVSVKPPGATDIIQRVTYFSEYLADNPPEEDRELPPVTPEPPVACGYDQPVADQLARLAWRLGAEGRDAEARDIWDVVESLRGNIGEPIPFVPGQSEAAE